MKNILTLLALMMFGMVYCQNEPVVQPPLNQTQDDQIYALNNVEVRPEFPGGIAAFESFVRNSVKTKPAGTTKNRAIVSFIVEKDGAISTIKVLRGLSPEINSEILDVLKRSPRWTPGFQNGKQIRVMYSLPISFDATSVKQPTYK